MDRLLKLVEKQKKHHLVLALVMAIFILFDISVPDKLALAVDSIVGRLVVLVVVVYLFMLNPVVGSLAIVAAYVLLKRSELASGSFGVQDSLPSETVKNMHLTAYNQFPETLEEEMVEKIPPHGQAELAPPSFKPLIAKNKNAFVV
jgi:hypothetical protein